MGFVEANDVIGIYPLCNTGSLVIIKLDEQEERVLVGLNGQNPEWCKIEERMDPESPEETIPGFYWGELYVSFTDVCPL